MKITQLQKNFNILKVFSENFVEVQELLEQDMIAFTSTTCENTIHLFVSNRTVPLIDIIINQAQLDRSDGLKNVKLEITGADMLYAPQLTFEYMDINFELIFSIRDDTIGTFL
jgi:hypothetical protein